MQFIPAPRFRLLSVAAALLLLNQALAFSNWWPTPAVVPDHRLAPEFVWLWLILLGIGYWRGSFPGRWLSVLAVGYLVLVLGRYGKPFTVRLSYTSTRPKDAPALPQ